MKIGLLGIESPVKMHLANIIEMTINGQSLESYLFRESPLSYNKNVTNKIIPLAQNHINVELMKLHIGSCDQAMEYKKFKSCDILIFYTNQLTNSNLNLLIAIGDIKKSNQILFIVNSTRSPLDDPFTEISVTLKESFYNKYLPANRYILVWPKKPKMHNYRTLVNQILLQINTLRNVGVIDDEKRDNIQLGTPYTHLIEASLPSLRAQLLQKYIDNLYAISDDELHNPVNLVRHHSDIVIKLDNEFREGCSPLIIGRDNIILNNEYTLFHGQLLFSLQLAQDTFNFEYDISHLSQNIQTLCQLISETSSMQKALSHDIQELKQICVSIEMTSRNIRELTLQLLEQATTITIQSKQTYDDTASKLREYTKKLRNERRDAFFKTLIMAVGLAFTGYSIYCAYQLGGLSAGVKTISNMALNKALETVAPPIVKPFVSIINNTVSDLVMPSPIIPSTSAYLQSKTDISVLAPFDASNQLVPDIPSVYSHLQNSTQLPIISAFDFKMPPVPSASKCSIGGYWDAVVRGFHKEDEYTKLAFEMGLELQGQMETRAQDFAGMMGAYSAARGHNIYHSIKDYHQTCAK